MSNTKYVWIRGRVPFNWLDREISIGDHTYPGQTVENLALFASVFGSPSMGLRLSYQDDGYEKNDHGGKTEIYLVDIMGVEAVSPIVILTIIRMMRKAGGIVSRADITDLDDGNSYDNYLLDPASEVSSVT